MSKTLKNAMIWRRSNYDLTAELPISDENLAALIKTIAEEAPSPMNVQSGRLVLLLGDNHKKLWEIVRETLRKVVDDAEKFKSTDAKIDGFAAGYGTILYYNVPQRIKDLQEEYPTYAHNFPRWADQVQGVLLQSIWTALAAEGIAANIQHYNPLIDEEVAKTFDISPDWELIGQMPFGLPGSMPEPRDTDELLTVKK